MVIEFAKGQVQLFVATRDFALNFEDRKIPSVKIREGETVQYDGSVAIYTKSDGDIAKGRCPGLKSAINIMGWLDLVEKEEETPELPKATEMSAVLDEGNLFEDPLGPPPQQEVEIPLQDDDYSHMKGGSFDTYAQKESDIHVVGSKNTQVIKENDLIVKEIPAIKKAEQPQSRGKLEVAGDQVEIKLVTSSTVTPRAGPKRGFKVVAGDEYGADSSTPMTTKKAASAQPQQRKSFVVDDTTPRATEGMSREEVQRITKVINADESQDAKVVRTIDKKMDVKEIEGITLRKVESPKDITFKKRSTPDGLTITTKVSSGSTGVADISQQGGVVVASIDGVKPSKSAVEPQEAVVIGKIGEPKDEVPETAPLPQVEPGEKVGEELIADIFEEQTPEQIQQKEESERRAKVRADGRKKSATVTQKAMEKSSTKKQAKEVPETSVPPVSEQTEDTDYLSMLPDDWGKMHWVKKEQFIKKQTDTAFIRFIQSVEMTKAVQNACAERLTELEQTG